MTNFDSAWNFDWLTPYPHQDSDLLKQIGFIPGLKELLMLRQVHALEHATVWVLSEMAQRGQSLNRSNRSHYPTQDNETLGGLSTDTGFYLYGQVNLSALQQAVREALQRLQAGEWNLAVHPRCGTNLSVAIALTAGLALGAHLILPRGPIEQLIGLGIATSLATQLAPDLGTSTQRYLTTAIPFNLEIVEIVPNRDLWRRSAYFVQVRWRDLQ